MQPYTLRPTPLLERGTPPHRDAISGSVRAGARLFSWSRAVLARRATFTDGPQTS